MHGFIGIFMMLSQEILLPFTIFGMGNWSTELWILVYYTDDTDHDTLSDSDDSCGYCNEVVQEKEKRRCTT